MRCLRAFPCKREPLSVRPECVEAEWLKRFGAKIGLASPTTADLPLIEVLLSEMTRQGADFTNSFRGLIDDTGRGNFADPSGFDAWATGWRARLEA